jgi:hypothetical protein
MMILETGAKMRFPAERSRSGGLASFLSRRIS